jgi:hypothetical protein
MANIGSGPRRCLLFALVTLFISFHGSNARTDESAKTEAANPSGRPVYLSAGRIVVFPEGVDAPPDDYKGSIGAEPLALVKIKGKIVGEIFSAPLRGEPMHEAKGLAASAERNKKMTVLEQKTIKEGEVEIVVVTMKMELNSNFGTPWILHSLYFPRGKASSTFKLVASESEFKTVLPYFEETLGLKKDDSKDE